MDNTWVEGNLIEERVTEKTYILEEQFEPASGGYIVRLEKIEVYPNSVCQYTGHTDMYGRKIFEHDRLRDHDDNKNEFEIIWEDDEACYYATEKDTKEVSTLLELQDVKLEVVGNALDYMTNRKVTA